MNVFQLFGALLSAFGNMANENMNVAAENQKLAAHIAELQKLLPTPQSPDSKPN